MFYIIREKEKWDSIISECDSIDFYHTYDYHQLAMKKGEEPVLICFKEKDTIIALPLLFRNIKNTKYKDATSVYGYPGPITKNVTKDYDNGSFQEKLRQLFIDQNIISVFSRLNPFVPNQEICLNELGTIETLGRIVYFDLKKTLENQWAVYHKRLRTYINKYRKIYTLKKVNTPAELTTFIKLYHENMKRVNATYDYFFDEKYFTYLLHSKDFNTEILLALYNETNEIAGGAIFIFKDNIIQYHLSGVSEKYLDLSPIKLLIDEMRIRATMSNYSYFNLGGGLGNREDSLFHFKSGFSKDFKPFKVWKYIVDHNVYKDLVHQNQKISPCIESDKYFPLYRCGNEHNLRAK